jgi:acyl-coenzyme A thioesterase PaaI-like protein
MPLLDLIRAYPLPFAELIGVEFTSAGPNAVAARMVVRPDATLF